MSKELSIRDAARKAKESIFKEVAKHFQKETKRKMSTSVFKRFFGASIYRSHNGESAKAQTISFTQSGIDGALE